MQSILKRPVTSGSGRSVPAGAGECSVVVVKAEVNGGRCSGQVSTAEDSDKLRAPNFTTAELTALLDLINNDYHFAHGNWDKVVDIEMPPGEAQMLFRERWMAITNQINAVGGYDREWREVKRKLTTWMSKVKKKAAEIHAYNILSSGKTDGRTAAAAPRLSPLDERVLSLLNQDESNQEMATVGLLNSAVSCELVNDEQGLCESPIESNANHLAEDMLASDESAWTQRQQIPNSSRNMWDHLPRVADDTDTALFEINKSVKSLIEIGKKRMKLEEKKLKVEEELVQVQKELNSNILKLIQGNLNSG